MRYYLSNLSQKETEEYIAHRLYIAGAKYNPFLQDAVEVIYQHSGGIPRRINHICDTALLAGMGAALKQIDGSFVKEVIESFSL